ncbi:hypothetical protein OsJ_34270 [Oryza sativa Japonica Group]|uniref:Uncharacterized protein n=1 Tax=Oryza sativa subsp. japonica TaxID=39947 RepID=B9GB76_ORYSJ|nr:hypothetical protein OsJ_34270 [Oryza sativa Japonica Group]
MEDGRAFSNQHIYASHHVIVELRPESCMASLARAEGTDEGRHACTRWRRGELLPAAASSWRSCRSLSSETPSADDTSICRRDVPASPVTRPLPRDVSTRRRDAVETSLCQLQSLRDIIDARLLSRTWPFSSRSSSFLTLEEIAGRSAATRSPHTVVVSFGYYASASSRRTL